MWTPLGAQVQASRAVGHQLAAADLLQQQSSKVNGVGQPLPDMREQYSSSGPVHTSAELSF